MGATSGATEPADPWRRIAVVGCTGAGKSTLARELADRLSLRHIELDALHFAPGWQPRPLEEFRRSVDEATSTDRWVADGNWRPIRDLLWSRATGVVWLDYSLATCFTQTLRRTVRRCWTGERVCGDNRETFRQGFASRDSVLLWVLRVHAGRRVETERDLSDPKWSALNAVRLRNQRETDAWLESISLLRTD